MLKGRPLLHRSSEPGSGRGKRGRGGALITAGLAFLGRGLQPLSNFILTVLAARFISPADYGAYTLSMAFILLTQAMFYSGYYQFLVTQKDDDERRLRDTSFWLIAGLALVSAVVLWIAAPFLAVLFDSAHIERVLRLLSLAQPFAAIAAWCSGVLLRQRLFKRNASLTLAQNLLALVVGVALLALWQSLYALVAFRFVRVVSGVIFYLPLTPATPGFAFDRRIAARATRYASALYGSRILAFLAQYSADIVLGLTFSAAEAGLYRFGNRLATAALDIVQQPLTTFALAQFGAAARDGRPLGRVLVRFASTMLTITGIVAASIAVFVAPLVAVAFQPAYLAAVGVTYALAARAVFGTGQALVDPVLAACDRTGRAMAFAAAAGVAQVAVAVVTAPLGLTALAAAQAATAFVTSACGLVLVSRIAAGSLADLAPPLGKAALLVALYGLVAFALEAALDAAYGTSAATLAVAVALAGLVAVGVLAVALRIRAASLSVFSE